jgi:CRP-like cAMP-binding protein
MLCYRMRKALNAVGDLGLATLRQRIARQLCTIAKASDSDAGAAHSSIPLTQEGLAALVGGTRARINGELAAMEQQGLVQRSYGSVTVIDYARLHALCETKEIFDLS